MALPVTAADVENHMGRPITDAERTQVELWLAWLDGLITERLGDPAQLNQATLAMVACEVIASKLSNRTGAISTEVAVDDGRMVTRYATAEDSSLAALLDGWWDTLSPAITDSPAFTVAPTYTPDVSSAW